MMMMPFVRLLAIYAIVGAAIFAFLKRDELIEHFSTPEAEMAAEETAANPAPESVSEPVVETKAQAATASPQPNYSAPATFGSQVSPQYFGQANNRPASAGPRPATPASDLVTRWTRAREVYSQGNTTEAANLYEALVLDFPQNADLHGETGNLYYNLGQFNKAAGHYYSVAEIAMNRGDTGMVGSMYSLLQRIAPAKATELQTLMAQGR